MKSSLKAAILVAVSVGFASAASAQTPASMKWTGFYVGGVAGGSKSATSYTNPGTPSQDLNGGMYGFTVGADYQFNNPLVVGIMGDMLFGNIKDSVRDGNYIVESGRMDRNATLRARLGYAMGNFLPYVTGGLMWNRLSQFESCPSPAAAPFGFCNKNGPFALEQSKTSVAPVFGAGLEYGINKNWSVKVEGLYAKFKDIDYVLGPDANGKNLPLSRASYDVKTIRLGVNYHF